MSEEKGKYRIIEHKYSQGFFNNFKFNIQFKSSILGISYWKNIGVSDYFDVAKGYIKDHKEKMKNPKEKIIHEF